MTAQVCGLLDLGGARDPSALCRAMADALCLATGAQSSLFSERAFALAQIALHETPAIARHGSRLVAGNFDLAYPTANPDSGLVDAHGALALLGENPAADADRIDGEYAVVHWDGASETLTLIRDRMGTRPLYYAHRPGAWFAFASTPGALKAAGLADATPCADIIAKIAIGNFAHGAQTQLRDIYRVIPASALTVQRGKVVERSYWTLQCVQPISPNSDYAEAIAGMRDVLTRAVRRRLPEKGPAFSHLSGGLDSSAIAALAAEALHDEGRPLVGYAFYPRPGAPLTTQIDERPEVEAVVGAWDNIDLRPIDGDLFALLPSAPMDPSFPVFLDSNEQYTLILADAAASGARTIFSGFGGDQGISFHGTYALSELFVSGQWRTLWRLAGQRARRAGRQRWRVIARDLFQTVLPGWARKFTTLLVPRLVESPDPFHRFLRADTLAVAKDGLLRQGPDTRRNRRDMLGWGHLTYVLEEIAWRAAQHGLGYTLPLLDREVLEYMIRLPGAFFMQGGRGRTVMRDSVAGVLPEQVRERPFKLIPDPGKVIRVSGERARYGAVVNALRGTRAEQVFDLDAIDAAIEAMPSPVELVARTETLAARGIQYAASDLDFLIPLVQARFLAGLHAAPLAENREIETTE